MRTIGKENPKRRQEGKDTDDTPIAAAPDGNGDNEEDTQHSAQEQPKKKSVAYMCARREGDHPHQRKKSKNKNETEKKTRTITVTADTSASFETTPHRPIMHTHRAGASRPAQTSANQKHFKQRELHTTNKTEPARRKNRKEAALRAPARPKRNKKKMEVSLPSPPFNPPRRCFTNAAGETLLLAQSIHYHDCRPHTAAVGSPVNDDRPLAHLAAASTASM